VLAAAVLAEGRLSSAERKREGLKEILLVGILNEEKLPPPRVNGNAIIAQSKAFPRSTHIADRDSPDSVHEK